LLVWWLAIFITSGDIIGCIRKLQTSTKFTTATLIVISE